LVKIVQNRSSLEEKEVCFIYAGSRGVGLDSALALYGTSLKAGYKTRLILSDDNARADLVAGIYPEAEFYDFSSLGDIRAMRREISGNIAFFTMISPKIIPLFLEKKAKKIFYFHATYDTSLERQSIGGAASQAYFNLLHWIAIRNSDLVAATQYPLAWQIYARFGKQATAIAHPPFSCVREGMFAASTKFDLPRKSGSYFLDFGGIDRLSKGTELLFKAVSKTGIPTVFAGRTGLELSGGNVSHLPEWLPDGKLHYLIKNAKCVVAPYLTASQFSSCAALAIRLGRPVLAPFSPTFEGWIENGKSGLYFSQGDWNDLREKMQGIMDGQYKFDAGAMRRVEKRMEAKSRHGLEAAIESLSGSGKGADA